jgi:hypothetical protein
MNTPHALVAGSVVAVLLAAPAALLAQAGPPRATLAEAKAMLDKAVAHYQSVGHKQALADFTAKKPPFADRDLYVVCLGPGGVITAHGAYPPYVGMSADALKDANGKPLGSSIWTLGSTKGSGTIDFMMANPVTKAVEHKTSYVQKVGEDVCAVGAYSPQ